jgi:hypothetical protein
MIGRLTRFAVILSAIALIAAMPATEAASAHRLSIKRARKAAYGLARRVGGQQGAVYAVAGFCKRQTKHRVNCWAGIVFSDYYGAAQKVKVTIRRGSTKAHAKRYGTVLTGYVGQQQSGQSGGEWAICGIHQSVCIGS